jgi:hypothetical protein
MAFRLHEGHVIWNAEVPIDALDPLGQEGAIRDFLTAALESGSLPAVDVLRLGSLAGFAAAQLRIVAKLMGIEFRKMPGFGKEGGFEWVAARDRGGEKVERGEERGEKGEVRRERPPEGGVPTAKGEEGGEELEVEGVEMEGGVIAVPVVISFKELMARTEAEAENADLVSPAHTAAPVAAAVAAGEGAAERALADAKNSKSMENRGKNEHFSNAKLPREKYARAQERKRRAKQRRETLLANGKR